ncbi:LANO_0D09472g1_1 [Lachancea nothofagi CBS 11611]|uniref:1,3-beta-glucanosyltransferase n=1 Tax=Lachancea nothofagi CBS 11611 TaxID=1266666 RepID=A0A1G4JJP2_9SACH|nr:LANO_0D09472g1_1 [Lachancea nothofagi CBS 11611]
MNFAVILINIFVTYFMFASGIIKAEEFRLGYTVKASDLPPIEAVGSKFFNTDTGEQFFIKGIAYQPSYSMSDLESFKVLSSDTKYIDPLASPNICLRDIPHLAKLGVNTIRVYAIDPAQSHDVCMEALMESGIYVLLDLSEPDASISRDSPSWDVNVYQRYKDVVDAMHQYSNVLGFFAGNEVTNDITNTDASTFVKASIRDIKEHIKEKDYRMIPVGYSTNDDVETRENLAEFFSCGDSVADFYGINMYEWCGYSSFRSSGYDKRTQEFKNYPVPVFLSEFGCNLVRPRPFTEVEALYSKQMTGVWSGGLAYMYFEEENQYGVVEIDLNNEVVPLKDFEFLKNEFARAKPQGISKSDYLQRRGSNSNKPPKRECPSMSNMWKASGKMPATPNKSKCSCLTESLPCLISPFNDQSKYKEYFDYVCGQVNCSDIEADGEHGRYGEFSDCTADQKLALQISKMYFSDSNLEQNCPVDDRHVYFNPHSKQTSEDQQCAAIINSVEKISKLRKNDGRHWNRSNNEKTSAASRMTIATVVIPAVVGIWIGWIV